MTAIAPLPTPPNHPAILASVDSPLYRKLAARGRAFVPRDAELVRLASGHAAATPARLRPRGDGSAADQPGVALFFGSRGPTAVIDMAAAERLADQLDQILAHEDATDARNDSTPRKDKP